MTKWVVIDNSDNTKYTIIGSNKKPKYVICEAPKYKGEYIINSDDIIVEEIYENNVIVEVKARPDVVKIKKKLKKAKKDKEKKDKDK